MQDIPKVNTRQSKVLTYVVIGMIIFCIVFLKQYFGMFVVAGILAYLCHPIYTKLNRRLGKSSSAAIIVAGTIIALIIPIALTLYLAFLQISSLSSSAANTLDHLNISVADGSLVKTINSSLAGTPLQGMQINQESVHSGLQKAMEFFGKTMINFLSSTVSGAIGVISSSIILIYVYFSLIKNGEYLIKTFRGLNPLGDDISNIYLSQIGAMVRGTVFGQLIIAFVQGLIAAIVVSVVTRPDMFFVLLILFTVLSVIPLGAGIVVIPIGVILILLGNITGGVIVLLQHLLINANIDNILRPILVPSEAKLDSALMLVSVFAGISMFGFLGIVIGPTLMVLVVTTIRMYLQINKNVSLVAKKAHTQPKRSVADR